MVGIYKERKALALSLSDTKTVVAKLHWVLDVILALFLVIIYLLVFNISATRLLVGVTPFRSLGLLYRKPGIAIVFIRLFPLLFVALKPLRC